MSCFGAGVSLPPALARSFSWTEIPRVCIQLSTHCELNCWATLLWCINWEPKEKYILSLVCLLCVLFQTWNSITRFLTAKAFLTSYTVVCGAGQTYRATMSFEQSPLASMPSTSREMMSVSTRITMSEWTLRVSCVWVNCVCVCGLLVSLGPLQWLVLLGKDKTWIVTCQWVVVYCWLTGMLVQAVNTRFFEVQSVCPCSGCCGYPCRE